MYELMERAGHAAFRQLLASFAPCKRILVLCGHGNNGGDGFVLARLAREAGLEVTLIAVGDHHKYSADTRQAEQKWRASGTDPETWPVSLVGYDVIVDALLGNGIKGEVRAPYEDVIGALNQQPTPVLSIDLPSGMNADTGSPCGVAVNATATITFVGIKAGLVTGKGKQHSGRLHFSALGIAEAFDRLATPVALRVRGSELSPFPPRHCDSHKGDHGHLLCIGGNQGMSGAIRLTADAALRSGAGLVKVLCHPDSHALVASGRPELMVSADTEKLGALLEWASCIVVGPGLGLDKWAESLFNHVLKFQQQASKSILIDADGLTLLARKKNVSLSENTVLTPHSGEAARLTDMTNGQIQADRYAAASELVNRYQCTIVLKGAGTLIESTRQCYVLEDGNPGMASGGMGDLLSGLIGGLMAQGTNAENAALAGACVHGRAGDLCAEKNGQRGMIASDLLPYIRQLVNC